MADSPALKGGDLVRLTITSDGKALPGTIELMSVSVRKAFNRIPVAEIVMLDGNMPEKAFPVSDQDYFKPGKKIKISAGYGQSEDAIFEGVVIRHEVRISGNNYSRLVIECNDPAVAMTLGRKNANFVDMKDSAIFSKLIDNYSGLSSDVSATVTEFKEVVQYYCTDWDFMLNRAEINGLLVSVESGKILVKAPDTDTAAKLKVTYGVDLFEFDACLDAKSQLTKVEGVSWDMGKQEIIKQQAAPKTLNDQGDLDSATLAKVLDLQTYGLQTAASMESEALKSWAEGQQVKSALSRIQGRMSFQGNAQATVGEQIELEGVGKRFNGKVLASAVHHRIEDGDWITEVEFGMPPDWFAERRDLVAPPASGLLPGVEGLHIGVVKKLDGDPEGQNKVQVTIPLLQAETEGVWARLAEYYASDGIGAFFVPEIGDEVVLGYINNDPSNPIILGSLYSSKHTPPYELSADNFTKALMTKSKLKLEFDDDKKVITIITPGNNRVVISDDDKSILLQDQNDNIVKLSEDGISLDSPKDIKITAKGKVSISATGNVELDSKGDFTASATNITQSANSGFTAKGNTSAEVSSSGQTTIKGSTVAVN